MLSITPKILNPSVSQDLRESSWGWGRPGVDRSLHWWPWPLLPFLKSQRCKTRSRRGRVRNAVREPGCLRRGKAIPDDKRCIVAETCRGLYGITLQGRSQALRNAGGKIHLVHKELGLGGDVLTFPFGHNKHYSSTSTPSPFLSPSTFTFPPHDFVNMKL